jgi:hypothetical protein
VEGITDEMIFQEYFDKIIDSHKFFVKVMNGDVFTRNMEDNLMPKELVGEVMKQVRLQTKFQTSDLALVAHLIDTDGIFIPESDYAVSSTHGSFDGKTYQYDLLNGQVIVNSKDNLDKLRTIWDYKRGKVVSLRKGITYTSSKVPYLLYFNSLNLEHVTHGNILSSSEKEKSAIEFIEALGGDFSKFEAFFKEKAYDGDYEQAWDDVISSIDWTSPKSNVYFLISKIKEVEGS